MPEITFKNRAEYTFNRFLEHFSGIKRNDLKLNEQILDNIKTSNPASIKQVQTIENLTNKEFKMNFLHKGIPVVMKGRAKEWKCVREWSPESLDQRFGTDPVSIIDENKVDGKYLIEHIKLHDVLNALITGDKSKYSRFNRILYDHPELHNDFDLNWLSDMRNRLSSGKTMQVFLGAKDTTTQLHAASEHNLFTQIYGKKYWYLISPKYDPILKPLNIRAPYFHTDFDPAKPDYNNFPAMQYVDIYQCTLEPGDILFNPPSYWHQIYNPTASIGLGFRWFSLYDSFKLSASQTLLTMMATNPSIFTATKYRTDFVKIFEHLNKK